MEHRTLLHGSRQRIVHAHDTIRSSIVHPRRNLQRVSVNTCCGAGFSRVDTERRYVSFRLTSMRERVTRVNLLSEFNARKWWFMRFRASLMRSLRTAWMTGLCNKSCKRAR